MRWVGYPSPVVGVIDFGLAAREGAKHRNLETHIGHRRRRRTPRSENGIVQLMQPMERHSGKGMMRSVILHLPTQPAHTPVGAGTSRVDQHVVLMRQTQMFDRVL